MRSASGSFLPSSPGPTPSPPLSRSQPLLGSYPLSLLHSRMSLAHAPHSLPSTSSHAFSLHLASMGRGKTCEPALRCTPSIDLPFDATYYDLEDDGAQPAAGRRRSAGAASQTPWVGQVDLEGFYFSQYTACSLAESHTARKDNMSRTEPPTSPGYQVAPLGQLQLVIKTPAQPVKAFVIPYDLRRLEAGGRLLVRERIYVMSSDGSDLDSSPSAPSPGTRKEALRYAIQLQFTCIAAAPPHQASSPHPNSAHTTRHTSAYSPGTYWSGAESSAKQYFLSRSIKLVFVSSPPGPADHLRTERHDELVPAPPAPRRPSSPSSAGGSEAASAGLSFSPGSSLRRAEEWDILRRKWFARQQLAAPLTTTPPAPYSALSRSSTPEPPPSPGSLPAPLSLLTPSTRTYAPARPASLSPTPPSPLPVPLPLALALPPVPLDAAPARPVTPTQNGFHAPARPRLQAELQRSSIEAGRVFRSSQGQAGGKNNNKAKVRRGSASREERELSERLRRLGRAASDEMEAG